jgi:hypothetical protein
MESKIEDGGPAFPPGYEMDPNDHTKVVYHGLTKRDWFAGQALAGLLGNPGGPYQANSQSGWGIVNCDMSHVATTCFKLADTMLAARKAGA